MPNIEFDITEEKIDRIVSSYNAIGVDISKENVKHIYDVFIKLTTNIKGQYLAHITRVIKNYFRDVTQNPLFIIKYTPYLCSEKKLKCGAAFYPGRRFVIFYQPDLPEKELRVRLAHELGHLFLLAVIEQKKYDKRLPVYEGTTEPLSSVFGIFTISDKNHFYANVHESDRNHKNWNAILDDFLALA
ncbi:MAG: hypothetical protein FWC19_03215 [Treponema sp.]|nr:hypothetical protein [Treponema sp.]MCL2271800.1 hypothetical protein [Treponema sp.]